MPVQVEVAQAQTVKDMTEYIGTIRSRNSAVIQPQVEGYLTHIFVHSGDHVRRGQRLMQIDPEKQQATVHTQEATRQSRLAQLALAKTDLDRKKQLAASGVISRSELDQAQATYDAAEADAKALGATVAEQQEQLRYYSITSPVEGTVGDIPVQVGDRVTNSTTLTTVDSGGDLELYLNIPAEKAKAVHIGTPVEIVPDTSTGATGQASTAAAAPYRTKVDFISPRIDTQNQLLLIKAAIPKNDSRFKNEQLVHADVIWGEAPHVVLPFYAVSRLSGELFAFVAQNTDKGTIARQVRLNSSDMTGNQYVVLGGVNPGDNVIVSGVQMLVDGMPVKPMPSQPQGQSGARSGDPSSGPPPAQSSQHSDAKKPTGMKQQGGGAR